jgi:predicted PurR-regulated permease PerM
MSKLDQGRIYAWALILLSAWIVRGFVPAMLAACVIAIASWPLYQRFSMRLSRRVGKTATAIMFTIAITVLVLAPMVFALLALINEAQSVLVDIVAADGKGIAAPHWLTHFPVVGSWLAARWQSELAHPGALLSLTHRTDPTAMLGLAQSLGQFTARHLLVIGFTILLLVYLYQDGTALGQKLTRALRRRIGERADRHVDVATRAVRSSVNSMLLVGLFDTVATTVAYAIAGAPHSIEWGAITGALAAIPFVGYAVVVAMSAQLVVQCSATLALSCFALGCIILVCGDKIVRALVVREGMRLPFVWVLIGCIGGFESLGLTGLVVGPLTLTLVRELFVNASTD